MSGPLGPGAEANTISQYKLWQKRVNDAGGIFLKKFNKKVPVELVAYDDRGQPDELIKLMERLVLQDKVDLVLSPYATHMNLAAAPILNKYEYPTIMTTAGAERIVQLAPSLPYIFWSLAQPMDAASPLATMCGALKKDGKIKGRVAAIHVAQDFGVEMNAAFTEAAKKEGLEIVYSKSYPFGSADLQPLLREVMATNPDAFIAFSYPPDSFMLTEQSKIVDFNPAIFYAAIGSAFPDFKGKFGNNVNGILVYDAMDSSVPGFADYNKAHEAMYNNRPSMAGAVGVYACLEVIQQAIERTGEIDRKKIRDAMTKGPFKTVAGDVQFANQRRVDPWAVGQWQKGEVVGVYPANKKGAVPLLFPKPAWTA
jgi:branched-chain amino acid transport system substrate-binding protein